MTAHILIIEDDEVVQLVLRTLLERGGYRTTTAANGRDGLQKFFAGRPDLVILDVSMPELDGWQTLGRIRELSNVPVMMLSAHASEPEKVRGLAGGADDYVAKPFGKQEMLARVAALLRRSVRDAGDEVELHVDELLAINFAQRSVTVAGSEVRLTPLEFKLLSLFARNANHVLSHDQILERVWGDSSTTPREHVKLYVRYLRRKLSEAAAVDPIETVRGFGYRYRPAAAAG